MSLTIRAVQNALSLCLCAMVVLVLTSCEAQVESQVRTALQRLGESQEALVAAGAHRSARGDLHRQEDVPGRHCGRLRRQDHPGKGPSQLRIRAEVSNGLIKVAYPFSA